MREVPEMTINDYLEDYLIKMLEFVEQQDTQRLRIRLHFCRLSNSAVPIIEMPKY